MLKHISASSEQVSASSEEILASSNELNRGSNEVSTFAENLNKETKSIIDELNKLKYNKDAMYHK